MLPFLERWITTMDNKRSGQCAVEYVKEYTNPKAIISANLYESTRGRETELTV